MVYFWKTTLKGEAKGIGKNSNKDEQRKYRY